MNWIDIASIIGLSSIISAIVTYLFENLKKKQEVRFVKVFEEKYIRYNHILSHMLIILDTKNLEEITTLEPKIKEKYEKLIFGEGSDSLKIYLLKELNNYINFYYLFSSNKVMQSLNKFSINPTKENYIIVAQNMKKDLWN